MIKVRETHYIFGSEDTQSRFVIVNNWEDYVSTIERGDPVNPTALSTVVGYSIPKGAFIIKTIRMHEGMFMYIFKTTSGNMILGVSEIMEGEVVEF